MAFFDDLGKKITQTGQGVVQKTKDTAETIKLNGMISDEEKNIVNFYAEIGRLYFELHADSYEPAFEHMISGIKEAKAKTENYAEQVKKLKGVFNCPNCGGEVSYGASFCSSCGAKMNVQNSVDRADNSDVRHCVGCGAPLNPGMAFCTNCGTKVEPIGALNPVDDRVEYDTSAMQGFADAAAPTTKICPACGKEIAVNAKFCIGCGSRIED